MSAEDDLRPQHPLPQVDSASAALLAEFWDDAESDQRNIELIGWWLSSKPDDQQRDSR